MSDVCVMNDFIDSFVIFNDYGVVVAVVVVVVAVVVMNE
jgi:hypothetical protein